VDKRIIIFLAKHRPVQADQQELEEEREEKAEADGSDGDL